jgi:hypothetical protein
MSAYPRQPQRHDLAQTAAFSRVVRAHAVAIVAALAYAAYELYASRLSAYAIWFMVAAVNGLLSGKFGAGSRIFVTATAAACVCAGWARPLNEALRAAAGWLPACRPGGGAGAAGAQPGATRLTRLYRPSAWAARAPVRVSDNSAAATMTAAIPSWAIHPRRYRRWVCTVWARTAPARSFRG